MIGHEERNVNDPNDELNELISKVAAKLGGGTPVELLRIEVQFLTSLLQQLLGSIVAFPEARAAFFRNELGRLLETLNKPTLHIP